MRFHRCCVVSPISDVCDDWVSCHKTRGSHLSYCSRLSCTQEPKWSSKFFQRSNFQIFPVTKFQVISRTVCFLFESSAALQLWQLVICVHSAERTIPEPSDVTRAAREDICPRAQHFGGAKLKSECYVLIISVTY